MIYFASTKKIADKGLREKRGITMLLVVVILTALLSISIGIFGVVFGEIKISGEIADSFIALYSADQSIEELLYRDRIQAAICSTPGVGCYVAGPIDINSGGCYTIRVDKVGGATTITSSGQYRCGLNPSRVVKRGLKVSY